MNPSTRYRDMRYGITRVKVDTRDNGVQYVQAEVPLDTYPQRMTDKLLHWSRMAPERTFLARRKRLSDGTSGTPRQVKNWAPNRLVVGGGTPRRVHSRPKASGPFLISLARC